MVNNDDIYNLWHVKNMVKETPKHGNPKVVMLYISVKLVFANSYWKVCVHEERAFNIVVVFQPVLRSLSYKSPTHTGPILLICRSIEILDLESFNFLEM